MARCIFSQQFTVAVPSSLTFNFCSSCIESELADCLFYCPECSVEHKGSNIDDFSQIYVAEEETAALVLDVTDTESFEDENLRNTRDSKESHSRPLSQRGPCQEPGCQNKSLSNAAGFCLVHTKNLNSNITAVARDMADTNLNTV